MRRRQIAAAAFALASPILFLAAAAAQQATDGFALFERFRADSRTAKMAFKQTNFAKDGAVLEEMTGTLWYRPPSFFRMEYDADDRPLVVSDGEKVWVYEADLRQATLRPFVAASENSILAALSAEGLDSLSGRYVFSSGSGGDLTWLVGEAAAADERTQRAQFGFSPADGDLRRIELADSFGGGFWLDITSLTRRDGDGLDVFSFTPPPDADVVRFGE